MRIDTLLHRLRFARTRGLAQQWIGQGHIRVNGERETRNARKIATGDVLTLPLRVGVAVIAIDSLPGRRGPPAEARACYRELDGRGPAAIARADKDGPPPAGES